MTTPISSHPALQRCCVHHPVSLLANSVRLVGFDTFPQNLSGSIQHAVTWRTVTSLMFPYFMVLCGVDGQRVAIIALFQPSLPEPDVPISLASGSPVSLISI